MIKNKISKNWLNKQNRDIFIRSSKVQGDRSRSAYKLIEINNKFKFIKNNSCLLDLGSAPGGWSQVVRKEIVKGKILAVDLKFMENIKDVTFIKGDFRDSDVFKKILNFFYNKADVVLSDMAENTTGNKELDSYRTGELCLNSMELSKKILSNDGTFLSKIFMGSIFKEIYDKAKQNFKKVAIYKPLASKKESKETYIFCKGIKKI